MRLRELIPEGLTIAARHQRTGNILVGKPGQIHSDLFDYENDHQADLGYQTGFVDHEGNFMDRYKAHAYAKSNKLFRNKVYKSWKVLGSDMIKGGSK